MYRGRVMLIGQNRAGKTSLKKSLLGLKFDPGEQSTEGIEVDPSRFELDVDRVMNWQLVKNEKFTCEFADDIARLVVGELRSGDEEKKPEVNSSEVDPVQTDVIQGVLAPQSNQVWWVDCKENIEKLSSLTHCTSLRSTPKELHCGVPAHFYSMNFKTNVWHLDPECKSSQQKAIVRD